MTSLASPVLGGMARTRFHGLEFADVTPASHDGTAFVLTIAVPHPLRETFHFTAGQHITLRTWRDGTEIRRTYSVCSTPWELHDSGVLRIGIRVLPGGLFSEFVRTLSAGATIEVMPPTGRFTTALDPQRRRRYAAVVAGSGITPVMSLVCSALETEPRSTFTVLYGNRSAASTMFADELADLKDRYPDRLVLTRVFSQEDMSVGLGARRFDAPVLRTLLAGPALSTVDEWFLCGPIAMVKTTRAVLAENDIAKAAIHTELFHAFASGQPKTPRAPQPTGLGQPMCSLHVHLDGRRTTTGAEPGQDLLSAALVARPELPYSCREGVCGTCRARVLAGTADMPQSMTLSDEERADGYVLTCQATSKSSDITLDFDV